MIKYTFDEKHLTAFGLIVLSILFLATYYYTVPAEDAVILYDYAKNLFHTGVITYGSATTPIEGATDFLWMICITLFKLTGLTEFFSALLLNLLAATYLLHIIRGSAYKLIALLALLFTPYLYSSLSGFSTLLFSVIFVYAVLLTLDKSRHLYICILLLCLVRPDGVVWGAGLVMWRLTEEWRTQNFRAEIKLVMLTLILPGVLYFIWRAWYFNELLPLPFMVKASGDKNLIIFHSKSLKFVFYALIPLIIGRLLSGGIKKIDLYFFLLPIIFYGMMRLEQNIGNRFIAPMFFSALFLFAHDRAIRPYYIFVIISVILSAKLTFETITNLTLSRFENVYNISQNLSSYNGKMLITEAGRLAYYSNWQAHDSWGLNTPAFAHKPIREPEINDGAYDLIVGHCDLSLLQRNTDLTTTNARTWENQCRSIIASINNNNYTIILVPFSSLNDRPKDVIKSKLGLMKLKNSPETCKRHDIYALSPNYKYADEVINVLMQYGAIRYTTDLKIQGHEDVCRPAPQ